MLRAWFLIVLLSGTAMAQQPLPVPTLDSHGAFFVGEWKTNAPTVIVFKDPFCPYCIKALERKHELENVNLFMFWYPIFGEKSNNRVAEFFQCASPVDDKVIHAVIDRKSPECSLDTKPQLIALNKKMYEAYNPPGVPAYYWGGQKLSFAEVKSIKLKEVVSLGVVLEWERYSNNRLNVKSDGSRRAALFFKKSLSKTESSNLLKILQNHPQYQWYIFSLKDSQLNKTVCEYLEQGCGDGAKQKLITASAEVELLYGLEQDQENKLIIDGRLVAVSQLPSGMDSLVQFLR